MIVGFLSIKINFLINKIIRPIRKWRLKMNVHHIHGPETVQYKDDEFAVVVLVRDGEPFIRSFIQHYISLGAHSIIIIDNGSIDRTVEIAKAYENTIILSCPLPYKYYQNMIKRYVIRRFCKQRWSLCVDIDEFFDFPFSKRINMGTLLNYLNVNGYTAVVTQMLDMIPEHAIGKEVSFQPDATSFQEAYPYFDTSDIGKESYVRHFGPINSVSNPNVMVYFGGIRKKAFNLDRILLTKHSLVFLTGKIRPCYRKRKWFSGRDTAHGIINAAIADISCVLYHYKFHGRFYENSKNYGSSRANHTAADYMRYSEVIEKQSHLVLKDEFAQRLTSVDQLVDNGFLAVSKQYADCLEKRAVCG